MADAKLQVGFPSEIATTIRAIVSRASGAKIVLNEDSFSHDLFFDASTRAELLMAAELSFHCEFSVSEAATISTVADLIAAVERKGGVEPVDPAHC